VSADPDDWVTSTTDGARLRVHVRPGSGRPGLAGFRGGALCVRVGARPVEGEANRELTRTLAGVLGVAPAAVEIAHGKGGREKRIHVRGVTADAVRSSVLAGLGVDTGPQRP
jgi:uncharacterized protein (TIGR00251 family)